MSARSCIQAVLFAKAMELVMLGIPGQFDPESEVNKGCTYKRGNWESVSLSIRFPEIKVGNVETRHRREKFKVRWRVISDNSAFL